MKTQMVFKLSMACAAVMLLYGNAAHATKEGGVSCPAGYTAERSNENKSLKCHKQKTYTLRSVCPALPNFPDYVTMNPTGSDTCLNREGESTPSGMESPGSNYPPISSFTRVRSAGGVDTFTSTRPEYIFPEGANFNTKHDPSKGVNCPSKYDGESRFSGKGIRCLSRDYGRERDCEFGLDIRQDAAAGYKDQCRDIFGNLTSTKPKGMTRSEFQNDDASNSVDWYLHKEPGVDTWSRRIFKYPESKN